MLRRLLRFALSFRPYAYVLLGRQPGKQRRLLEHHHALAPRTGNGLAAEQHPPRVGQQIAGEQRQQRALAAATRADNGDELASLDCQVHFADHVNMFAAAVQGYRI